MGIFSNKPKVNMESFCRDYYDSQMFHAVVNGEDGSQKILNAAFQLLADSEPSFSKIDRLLFESEMIAMHLELFALAFFRRFSNFNQAVQQCISTLSYLKEKDRTDIWEAMGKYNKAIAQTATMKTNGQQMTGDTSIERMTITRVNQLRAGLFEKWLKSNFRNPEHLTSTNSKLLSALPVSAIILKLTSFEITRLAIGGLLLYFFIGSVQKKFGERTGSQVRTFS